MKHKWLELRPQYFITVKGRGIISTVHQGGVCVFPIYKKKALEKKKGAGVQYTEMRLLSIHGEAVDMYHSIIFAN